jgi:Na+/H+-translocating membrane pyrophosphatase
LCNNRDTIAALHKSWRASLAHVHFGGAFGSVQYYTSHSYKPVREVAASCETGAATNIIYGLALGMLID